MKFTYTDNIKKKLTLGFFVNIALVAITGIVSIFILIYSGVSVTTQVFNILTCTLISILISFFTISNVLKSTSDFTKSIENLIENGTILNKDDEEKISQQFEVFQNTLKSINKDINNLHLEHSKGNLKYNIDTKKYNGTYSIICNSINEIAKFYLDLITDTNNEIESLCNGNLHSNISNNQSKNSSKIIALDLFKQKLLTIENGVSDMTNDIVNNNFESEKYEKIFNGNLTSIIQNIKKLFSNTKSQIFWYESMLDSIPFPISVTDMDMNWTFINKPVENLLGLKRKDILGKHCSNWGAGICKTEDCGIGQLRGGKSLTFFKQKDMDFQVNVSYLYNEENEKVGHIEVVQDVTKLNDLESKKRLVEQIKDSCVAFATVSTYLAESSQKTALNSTMQSEFMDKISKAFELLLDKASSTSQMAKQASDITSEIKTKAELGSIQMDNMLQSVSDMSDANQSIFKIIKNIEDIAFQTNILALNASVEAARAGHAGKGFAVVAEEVRNLAEKSAEAANNSNTLISNSLEKAKISQKIANETTENFSKIVSRINDCDESTSTIVNSSNEQILTIEQINTEIDNMLKTVVENSAVAQESASASEELSSQASVLEELVIDFADKNNSIKE